MSVVRFSDSRRLSGWLALLSLTSLAAACGGDGGTEPPPPPGTPVVTTVEVRPEASEMVVGQTVTLTAVVRDQDGDLMTGQTVTWSSSDPGVVSVSATGLARGEGQGTASVSASVAGISGSASFTVAGNPDRNALEAFYYALGGDGWDNNQNWLSSEALAQWFGVQALGVRVEGILLSDNGLTGRIPPEIGQLDAIRSLRLNNNAIGGSLPDEFGDLAVARTIDLSGNNIDGPLPTSVANLGELDILLVTGNNDLCLRGTSPVRAWSVSVLDSTDAVFCNELDRDALSAVYRQANGSSWTDDSGWLVEFTGVGDWTGITADDVGLVTGIDLSGNGLSGGLAAEIGRLGNLTSLDLSGNPDLAGALPVTLAKLSLDALDYSGTDLCVPDSDDFRDWLEGVESVSGPGDTCVPRSDREVLGDFYDAMGGNVWFQSNGWNTDAPLDEWAGVSANSEGRATGLELQNNNLQGDLTSVVSELTELEVLNLRNNGIGGTIPAALGTMANLRVLRLDNTSLGGRIPPELGDLQSVVRLDLDETDIMGAIPPEIGNISNLERLNLTDTGIKGPLPAELGNLSELRRLEVGSANVGGILPEGWGSLSRLEYLDLGDNLLVGSMPDDWSGMTSLELLRLENNNLSGGISPVGSMSQLEHLSLYNNNFEGELPAEVGQFSNLRVLDVERNELTGSIPDLSGTNLQILWLSDNDFSGELPSGFGQLTSLTEAYIYNLPHLEGGIPDDFGGSGQLHTLILSGNPGLSGAVPESMANLTALVRIDANNTPICVPPDNQVLFDWVTDIYLRRLATCGTDGSRAYLVQAVQNLEHPVPLVADRSALLRVFVISENETSEGLPPVVARFHDGDTEVHTVEVGAQSTAIPTEIMEGDLDQTVNVEIPADVIQPGLEMVIEIDPDGTLPSDLNVTPRIPAEGRMLVDVQVVPPFDVMWVPWTVAGSGDSSSVQAARNMAENWETDDLVWDTRYLLPVPGMDGKAHDAVETDTNDIFDLLNMTRTLRLGSTDGGTQRWAGLMNGVTGAAGVAWVPGLTSMSVLSAGTISHELGHNLGLRHAPCGGPAGPDPYFPDPSGTIGSWGYDARDSTVVSPTTPDVMSYCGPHWISDFYVGNSLRFFDSEFNHEALPRTLPRQESLFVWGWAAVDGTVHLYPSFVAEALPAGPESSGPYRLVATNEDGAEVFAFSFEMADIADGDGRKAFNFALPVGVGWESISEIRLTGPGGSAFLDVAGGGGQEPLAIVRDPDTGTIRAFLRGERAEAADAVARGDLDALHLAPVALDREVLFSRGIPPAGDWRQ